MGTKALTTIEDQLSISVAASFTVESLEVPLRFWMDELRLQARIQFAPYGQLFQQLLVYERSTSNINNAISVILVRVEDWGGEPLIDKAGFADSQMERNLGDFLQYLRAAAERGPATFILCLCPPSRYRIVDSPANALINKMENHVVSEAGSIVGVHVLHYNELAKLYPVSDYCDDYTDKLAHIPYTAVFFTALGTMIARKIYALRKRPHKVIVLDCDSTLWEGAAAEDGPAGVQIDSTRRTFHEFMLRQQEAGMILCLCSKNNEEDVKAVFDAHPEMLLRWNHILTWRINWRPKSENLISLAKELNLGLESFIFIDNDPVECAEVKSNCPEVMTIQLPRDTESIPRFLDHLWVFDHGKITAEDKRRTELYRGSFRRNSVQKRSLTLAQFLEQLRLTVHISVLTAESLERASDLTVRTNQFNLTTIRYSESDLKRLQQEGSEILVVNVKDRFGDYGLVGVIVFGMSSRSLRVETFLLSCRAMGRGVEQRMLARLGEIALDRGVNCVELLLRPTSKNRPAQEFLESFLCAQKEDCDDGRRYRITARAAADCKLQPDQSRSQNGAPSETVAPTVEPELGFLSGSSRDRNDDFIIDIATRLNEPYAIHKVLFSTGEIRPEIDVPFVAPSSAIEKEVAGFWTELLGFEQIGINDSFLALGGHSLLAMQVLSRIRTGFNVELSPRLLVTDEFTVAGLSKAILVEQIRQSDTSEIEKILESLTSLTDDELTTMLDAGDKK
jgi:FkbH-like protein